MIQKLLLEAKRKLGEILSAYEFLDAQSLDLVNFLWELATYNIFSQDQQIFFSPRVFYMFYLRVNG